MFNSHAAVQVQHYLASNDHDVDMGGIVKPQTEQPKVCSSCKECVEGVVGEMKTNLYRIQPRVDSLSETMERVERSSLKCNAQTIQAIVSEVMKQFRSGKTNRTGLHGPGMKKVVTELKNNSAHFIGGRAGFDGINMSHNDSCRVVHVNKEVEQGELSSKVNRQEFFFYCHTIHVQVN